MKTLDLKQGSPEWLAHRATARNASDAPAVLGCSPYTTRSQLLHQRHTGITPEVDASTQRRFDAGHAIEAAQLPGAEEIIGQDLYPAVGTEVVDGIELSASFDGIPMDETVPFECKSLNDELRAALQAVGGIEANDGRNLPKNYRVQAEQQLMVCGGQRLLFVAANATGDDVRRCWYYPDPALRAEILAGWKQFDADLAAYVPPSPAAVEKIVAEPVEALPAVYVKVEGSIVIRENFDAFETAARDFLANRLILSPKTDNDFATLEVQIKAMKGAEAALDSAEEGWIAQIESVSAAKRRKDMLRGLIRENRLLAEKLLSGEKERRKGEIVAAGITALREHIAALNKRLGQPFMPATASAADFGGAVKGLKSLASMEDKVSTVLANSKIEANRVADLIDGNLKALPGLVGDRTGLTPDLSVIVLKSADDFAAVVGQRVTAQREAEQRRAEELAEQQRAKIAAEERAKLEREQAEAAEKTRQAAQAATPAPTPAPAVIAAPAPVQAAQTVVPIRPTPAPAAAPTLKLGQINERIAPLSIDAAGLAGLGFTGTRERGAVLFQEAQYPHMLAAMVQHLESLQAKQAA